VLGQGASRQRHAVEKDGSVEPIRVLYYEQPGLGPGGSRVSLQNMIEGLGSRVQAFIVGNLPREVLRNLPSGSGMFPAPRSWPPASPSLFGRYGKTARFLYYLGSTAIRLAFHIWRLRIDIIHGNNEVNSNAPAVLAAALTGRPCVSHLRGTLNPRWETRWLYKHVDAFIAICEHVRDFYVEQGLLGEVPATVIYNGVDVRRLGRRARFARLSKTGPFRVAVFGRLVEFKGHEFFVRAAAEVLRALPEIEFVIHGPIPEDGPEAAYYQSVRETAQSLGIAGRIHFAGSYEEVITPMAETDVVVCCSPFDNFGRILFEAMACGVPVVAFNCGGTGEVAVHEKNALLVPNRDCEALGQAIVRLARDRELRDRLIEEGQRTASDLFDYRTNADRVFQLYERLLGRTPTGDSAATLA